MRAFLSVLTLSMLCACAPTTTPTATTAAPGVQLYAMDCGHFDVSDAGVFSDRHVYDGQRRQMIVPCYLIRHPRGDLIWDTGVPEAIADQPNGVTDPPFHVTVPVKLSAQLAQLHLTPSDIEFLSVSHSHFDHIGNGNMFAHSTWIVDADEKAYAFRPQARADAQSFAAYNELEHANTRLIEGDADYDVFGDGSVTIIQAPGHTPGHTLLLVRLAHAGPILITGDMYHLAEARQLRTVPTFNTSREQTLASMDKVERIAMETHARVIREHVPEDFETLPHFPQALD